MAKDIEIPSQGNNLQPQGKKKDKSGQQQQGQDKPVVNNLLYGTMNKTPVEQRRKGLKKERQK